MDAAVLKQLVEQVVPFNVLLGVRLAEVHRGGARLEVPFRPELIGDPLRQSIHGGVFSALVDAAGGAALWSAIDEPRTRIATIDMRVDYLRPGRRETIVVEGTLVRLGKRIGVTDARVFHPGSPGETLATGKAVYNVVIPKAAP